METVTDIQKLLKRFGTVIYTGDRQGDLELMQDEIRELKEIGAIDSETYLKAALILQRRLQSGKG
ncbi:YqgQ family protein [Thermoactinomyces sp. CICC 10521]|uniref:YqgQ family protein n=2 Tax=Thermoactinomyces TaxID=2023 RepID=A0A7W1XBI5_9BACL|nr:MULTISPECIES: YqgQ family protein [Thermoactinomyces]MBA4543640.1 YqgQ family protein [Thermoactinomyces daqus]MBH8597091.1 YqgQ family protein [Thermoactinomyces sp. CICC 10523]MBH8602651.1 YqgQ family protein [Thermoactinomyces sp. CICC 10522]MBH8606238.1 YqgQ family protein [Thermoactinomyces sp. CICC 10521]